MTEISLYKLPSQSVKASSFFEVAKYLSDNNLWEAVESKLASVQDVTGDRIILDSLLCNAVKVVMFERTKTDSTPDPLISRVVECGGGESHGNGGGGVRG